MSESPNQKRFKIKLEDRHVFKDENGKAVPCMPVMTFIENSPGLYAASDNTCKTKEVMETYKKSDSPKNIKVGLNIDSTKFDNLINTLINIHPMDIIEASGRFVMHFNFTGVGDNDGFNVDISEQHDFLYIFCKACKMLDDYKKLPINILSTRNNKSIGLKVLIDNGSTSRNRHNTLEEKYILYNAKNFFAQKYNLDFLDLEIFNNITEITDDENHLTIYKNDGLNALGEKILEILSEKISEITSKDIQDWLLSDNLKAVLIEPYTTAFKTDEKKEFLDTIKEQLIIKLEALKELKEKSKEVIPGEIWNFELPQNFLTNNEQIPNNSYFAPLHYMQCVFYTCLYYSYSYSLYKSNKSDANIKIMRKTLINVLKIRDDFQKESLDPIYSTTGFSLEFLLRMILKKNYTEVLIKYVNNLYKNSIETAPHVTQIYFMYLKGNTIFNDGFLNKHNGEYLIPLKKLDELLGDRNLITNENISNGKGKVQDELEFFTLEKSVTKDELNKLSASVILSSMVYSNTFELIENLNFDKTKECINYLFNPVKEIIIEHKEELLHAFANSFNQRETFSIKLYINLNVNQFIDFYKVVGKNIFTIIASKYNSLPKDNKTKFINLFFHLATSIKEKDDKLTQDFTNDYFETLKVLLDSNVKDFDVIIKVFSVKEIMQHENIIDSSIKFFSQNHIEEIINFLLNSDDSDEKRKFSDILNQFVNFIKNEGRTRIFCALSIEHFYFLYKNTEIGNDIFISVQKYSKIAKYSKIRKQINDKYLELFAEINKYNNKFSQNFINGYLESLTFLLNSEFRKNFINIISNSSIDTIIQLNLVKFITPKNLKEIIDFISNPENNSSEKKEKYNNILLQFIECIRNKEANKIVFYELLDEDFIFLSKYPEVFINETQEYSKFSVNNKRIIIGKYNEFAKKINETNKLTPDFINLFFESLKILLNSEFGNDFVNVSHVFSIDKLIQYNVINDFASFFDANQLMEFINFILEPKSNSSKYNDILNQNIGSIKDKYIFYILPDKYFNFLLKYPEILINAPEEYNKIPKYMGYNRKIQSKYEEIAKKIENGNKLSLNFIENFFKSLLSLLNSTFKSDFTITFSIFSIDTLIQYEVINDFVSFFNENNLKEIIDFISSPENNNSEKKEKYNNILDQFIEYIKNKKENKILLYLLSDENFIFISKYPEVFINDSNEISTTNKNIIFDKYNDIATKINNTANELPETFIKNFFASLLILLNSDWKTSFVEIFHLFSINKLIELGIINDFANFFDKEQLETIIQNYYKYKNKIQYDKEKLEEVEMEFKRNSESNNSQSENLLNINEVEKYENKLKKITECYNKSQKELSLYFNILKKCTDFNDKDKITICHNVCYKLSIEEFTDIYQFFGKNIFIYDINDFEDMRHYEEYFERNYSYYKNTYQDKVTNKYIELATIISNPSNNSLPPALINNFFESLTILLKSYKSKDFIEVSYHFSPEIIFEHKDIFFSLPDFFDVKNLKRFLQYYFQSENDEQKEKCSEILQTFVKSFEKHDKHFFDTCYNNDLTAEEFILFYQFTGNNIFINEVNEINPEYAHFYYNNKIDAQKLKNKYAKISEKFDELPENFMNGYLNSFYVLLNSYHKSSFIEIFNSFSVKKLMQLEVIDNFFEFLGANQFDEIIQYYNDPSNEEKEKYKNLLLQFINQNLKQTNSPDTYNCEKIYDICYKLSAKSFIVIYQFIGNNIFKEELLKGKIPQSYFNYNYLKPIKNKCCELIDEISISDNLPTNFINDLSNFLKLLLEQNKNPLIICKCLLSGKFPHFQDYFEQFKQNEKEIIETINDLPNKQFIALYNLLGTKIFVNKDNHFFFNFVNLRKKYEKLIKELNKSNNNLPKNFIKDFFASFLFAINKTFEIRYYSNDFKAFCNILNENFSFTTLMQYKDIIPYQNLLNFFAADKLIEGTQYYNSLEENNPEKEKCSEVLKMFFDIIKQDENKLINLWNCLKKSNQETLFNETILQFDRIIESHKLFGKDIFIIKINNGNNDHENRETIYEYYYYIINKIKKNPNELSPNFIEDFLKILPKFYSKNKYYQNLSNVFSFAKFIQLRNTINLSNVIDTSMLESGLDYYHKNNDYISREILQNFANSIKDDKEKISDICFKLPDEYFIRFWEFIHAILIKKEDVESSFPHDELINKYISIASIIKIPEHNEFIMSFLKTLLSWGADATQAIMEIPFDILIEYPEISEGAFNFFNDYKFNKFVQYYFDLENNTDKKNKCHIALKQLLSTKDIYKHILQLKPQQVIDIISEISDDEFVALVNNFYLRRENYELYYNYYSWIGINFIKRNFKENFFWVDEKEIDDAANKIVNENKNQIEIYDDLKNKNKSPKKILKQRFPFVTEKEIDDATSKIINKSDDTEKIIFDLQMKNNRNIEQFKSFSKDIIPENIILKNILPEKTFNELTQQVSILNELVNINSNIEEQRKSFTELNDNLNDILGKTIMYFCCMVNDIISFIPESPLLTTIPKIIVDTHEIAKNKNFPFSKKIELIYDIFNKNLIIKLLTELINSVKNLPDEKRILYFELFDFFETETLLLDNYRAHVNLLIENIELDKKELNINNINENIPKMENFSDFRER